MKKKAMMIFRFDYISRDFLSICGALGHSAPPPPLISFIQSYFATLVKDFQDIITAANAVDRQEKKNA